MERAPTVKREKNVTREKKAPVRRAASGSAGSSTVAGLRISHPDRLIYADLGISKIQLAR